MPVTEWAHLDSEAEYDCDWFTAGYDLVERPDGETARYYWVEPSDSVAVVAVHDGQVVLVEQYRPRQRETVLACPAGGVDVDESFIEAGVRELREETGFEAERAELVQIYRPAGWLRQERGVVFAEGLTPGEQELDGGEFIDVRAVPVEDALETARDSAVGWALTPLLLAADEELL